MTKFPGENATTNIRYIIGGVDIFTNNDMSHPRSQPEHEQNVGFGFVQQEYDGCIHYILLAHLGMASMPCLSLPMLYEICIMIFTILIIQSIIKMPSCNFFY